MYEKKSFKLIAYYHMAVMGIVVVSALSYYLAAASDSSHISIVMLTIFGTFVGVAGYKLLTASRNAVILLILIHVLQLFNFSLGSVFYTLILGPRITVDFLGEGVIIGLDAQIGLKIFTESMANTERLFRINILSGIILLYLIDQLRFMPKRANAYQNDELLDRY